MNLNRIYNCFPARENLEIPRYQTCSTPPGSDTLQILYEHRGVRKERSSPLKKVLKAVGGWPVLEGPDWDKSGFKWYDMVYKLRDIGYPTNYIIGIAVGPNWNKPLQRTLYVAKMAPGMVESKLKTQKGSEVNTF